MMTPEMNQIYLGDNMDTMKTWPDGFVHTCVTSPPYYGLRDYGTSPRVWGGTDGHAHVWEHHRYYVEGGGGAGGSAEAFSEPGPANAARIKEARWREDDTCSCGAWQGHIGLEPTPDMFIAHLVEVFREVRRVLRDDGTLWLNLGDSYCSTGGHTKIGGSSARLNRSNVPEQMKMKGARPSGAIKIKDLIGIPWMAAFALRADGWYLRSEIIWAKKNCMPESVTDRPTKAHEQIFLLSKAQDYFYDHEAIKEASISEHPSGNGFKREARETYKNPDGSPRGNDEPWTDVGGMRNKRSVWNVPTKPFSESHFATFPPDLIAPCVLAGAPRGGVVLDPFMGAGTTALVAATHGRAFIGCELNPAYKAIADKRIANELAQEKFL